MDGQIRQRLHDLLLPTMTLVSDRHRWLRQAYLDAGADGAHLFYQIEFEGQPNVFVQRLIETSHNFGRLKGEHPLSLLLRAIRDGDYGVNPPPEYDALIAECNRLEAVVLSQREAVTAYLDRLEQGYLHIDHFTPESYTPLAGRARITRQHQALPQVKPAYRSPAFQVIQRQMAAQFAERVQETTTYDDIRRAVLDAPRAAVLGDPGAGKTTTLLTLAHDYASRARVDSAAPVPLFVELRYWATANLGLLDYCRSRLGTLGPHLDALLADNRGVLLLDGLDQVPPNLRQEVADQIGAFVRQHPHAQLLVSCREHDYMALKLDLDRITIAPLDPVRVLAFAQAQLGDEAGTACFWTLAGDPALRAVWQKWQWANRALTINAFWAVRDLQNEQPNIYHAISSADHDLWVSEVRARSNLVRLAANPFLLTMLLAVYSLNGTLPRNRGQLFAAFVNALLLRERRSDASQADGEFVPTPAEAALLNALQRLAFEMQRQRGEGTAAARTVMPLDAAVPAFLSLDQLTQARNASLLLIGEAVRFSHQLLQEYFAALALDQEISQGRMRADSLWGRDRWWERTNWEEVTVLLAGLHSDDCTTILDWVAEANPEVAARCLVRSGAMVPAATKARLEARWTARLTNVAGDPDPRSRAEVGRTLAMAGLDNRPGVGVRGVLPALTWCLVPAGPCRIGGDARAYDPLPDQLGPAERFWIARYPITNAQFDAFVAAPDGFANAAWWVSLQRPDVMRPSSFPEANAPRVNVTWYEATAFCRWLQAHRAALGLPQDVPDNFEIRLPTEEEWEKAARFPDGRTYPYGNQFDATLGNTRESLLGRTSAVGIFPHGVAPCGAEDLSGNAWEWTCSIYDDHGERSRRRRGRATAEAPRVLRGGSWGNLSDDARAASRLRVSPFDWLFNVGFRVVVSSPIHREQAVPATLSSVRAER